jgi:hypothetical protein
VDNLKARKDLIDLATVARFSTELRNLSLPHVDNLLITLFGIFVSPDTDQILRKNVASLSPGVWQCAEERIRYRIGTMVDGYRTNLQQDRLGQAVEFLRLVDGRVYETLPARIIALETLCDQLDDVHDGWDNFYNEPLVMKEILSYCRRSLDIPKECVGKLTRVILRCRIGRGLSYREGVSPSGVPLYDKFFGMLDDTGVANTIANLFLPEINSKLSHELCQKHLGSVLRTLLSITIAERLKAAIGLLLADLPNARNASSMREFRELTGPFIRW